MLNSSTTIFSVLLLLLVVVADFSFSPLSLFSSLFLVFSSPFSQIEVCSGSITDGSTLTAADAAAGSAAASSAHGCGLAREASRSTVQVSPPKRNK